MALVINDVAVLVVALPFEEVVEADFVKSRRGRVRRDVAADPLINLVGLHDHRKRVPANEALDTALDLAAAGKWWLFWGGDGVDVRGVGGERELDAAAAGVVDQPFQQLPDSGRPARVEDVIERLEPFAGFERFELGRVLRGCVTHASS